MGIQHGKRFLDKSRYAGKMNRARRFLATALADNFNENYWYDSVTDWIRLGTGFVSDYEACKLFNEKVVGGFEIIKSAGGIKE